MVQGLKLFTHAAIIFYLFLTNVYFFNVADRGFEIWLKLAGVIDTICWVGLGRLANGSSCSGFIKQKWLTLDK